VASLSDLVRSSLRLRPDRIPIGEVRGAEALDLLKAWGTGHPGGVGSLHAGSAIGALRRLEQLIQEAVVTVPRALIAETIDLIGSLAGSARRLTELVVVNGLRPAAITSGWENSMLINRARHALTLASHFFFRRHPPTRPAPIFWERPPQRFSTPSGPVAKIVSVIIIIVTGLTLAFGRAPRFRRLIQIVFGLSVPSRHRALSGFLPVWWWVTV
jgi:type IV secretion system protein VirB11